MEESEAILRMAQAVWYNGNQTYLPLNVAEVCATRLETIRVEGDPSNENGISQNDRAFIICTSSSIYST